VNELKWSERQEYKSEETKLSPHRSSENFGESGNRSDKCAKVTQFGSIVLRDQRPRPEEVCMRKDVVFGPVGQSLTTLEQCIQIDLPEEP